MAFDYNAPAIKRPPYRAKLYLSAPESQTLYDLTQNDFQQRTTDWINFRRLNSRALPIVYRRALLDHGSLTARLIKASNHNFSVSLLSQVWSRASLSESRLLNVRPQHRCMIREVLLRCNNQPWVYARSVLPAKTLRGKLGHLRRLGNKPLGQLLFSTPNMRRDEFELAFAPAGVLCEHPAVANYCKLEQAIWGRRSRFELYQKPLIVSEIFLPAANFGLLAKSI